MEKERLKYLLERYSNNTATPREHREFLDYLASGKNEELFTGLVMDFTLQFQDPHFDTTPYIDLAQKAASIDREVFDQPTGKIISIRNWQWAAAAILIIVLGSLGYFYYTSDVNNYSAITTKTNIPPGHDKAILTLADGSAIAIDSAANGELATQGNARITKTANGNIIYHQLASNDQPVMFNTMSTPKGGKYKMILPDGTGVWLNAASSITFPVVFTGKERLVKVKGEVYFEVAKDQHKPFIINVNDKQSVEVLGTSFNIDAYEDEDAANATLIDGSIKVSVSHSAPVILRPHEQAQVETVKNNSQIRVYHISDTGPVIAWKNDLFDFTGMPLSKVFRQIARWYDVDVRFDGNLPAKQLKGKISRSLPLSDVLELLSEFNLHFTIDGKTLTVKAG